MIFKTYLSYKMLCEQCFLSLKPLNKRRKEFFISVLWLFLSIKGKINFLQLERYGKLGEQSCRQQFDKEFEFLQFNSALVSTYCSQRTVIGFDPSYIPKSGKKTAGAGFYWSGCAGAAKWGLEFCGIAAIDIENHTAMHLEAVQTLPEEGENLLDFYANVLVNRKDELQKTSKIVVADAYFSKERFISKLCVADFQVISLFRDDTRLRYLIEPVKTGKRGRPKTLGEKVDVKNLNLNYFSEIESKNPNEKIYSAVIYLCNT